jgi:DNA-binding CsgD family transcriptional regulator
VSQTESHALTPREAEVLELIAHGLTNRQAGQRLDVTVHAVKFHLASIYRKLGVTNRTEAASLFFQHLTPARDDAEQSTNGGRSGHDRERQSLALSAPQVPDLAFAASAGGRGAGGGRA